MEKGAANHGDSPQRHAYELHGVGTLYARGAAFNATHNHGNHAVHPFGRYDHTGHAILGPGFDFSTNDIADGFNPFEAIAVHGAGYNNDGLSLGTNDVDASLYPYNNSAALSFINGAVQEATVTPNANNRVNHGYNDAEYHGHTFGNVTTPGIAYDQGLSAALPLQYSHGGYPTGCANGSFYPPNNGAAIGMAHGSSGYAINATTFGPDITGSTSTVSSTLPVSTAGSVGGHYLHYGNGDYPDGYSDINLNPSNNATATAIGMVRGSDGYATNGTAHGAPSTGATITMSSTLSHSTHGFEGDHYLQHGDAAYPTGYSNGICNPLGNATATAMEMADGSNHHAPNSTALAVPSANTTPTTSSALSPSTPGSVAEPNGRPRWACPSCVKTFSRQADMVRHARKHSGVLPYQCPVANCRYKGSYRQDKLEQHRRNRH